MFPVKYELGSYIPEDGILHSHYREKLRSYIQCIGYITESSAKCCVSPAEETGTGIVQLIDRIIVQCSYVRSMTERF
jgi:hypothetical protein